MKTKEEIIEFLESSVNLDKDSVIDLLFPFDDKSWAKEYIKKASCCAIYSAAFLRFLGFDDKELMLKYSKQIGMAVANLSIIGRRHNLLASKEELLEFPKTGDILIIGINGNEHALNVMYSDDQSLVVSSDSGQASLNTMARRQRMMLLWNGLAYLVDPTTPYDSNGVPKGRVISHRLKIGDLL